MANKKQIVIKVKYPSSEGQTQDTPSSPEIITEWNVKRIVSAFAVIVLLLSLVLYFTVSDDDSVDMPSSLSENQPDPEIKQEAAPEQAKAAGTEERSLSDSVPNDRPSSPPLPINPPEAGKKSTPAETAAVGEKAVQETAATASAVSEKKPSTIPKKRSQERVARSFLAHKIVNKEPVHIVNSTVKIGKTKAVWINYFTELKGMNNKAVYHEWLSKGKVTYRQRFNIASNRWRAASRKLFNAGSAGVWLVRTVDTKGRLLDQKEFKIIQER